MYTETVFEAGEKLFRHFDILRIEYGGWLENFPRFIAQASEPIFSWPMIGHLILVVTSLKGKKDNMLVLMLSPLKTVLL